MGIIVTLDHSIIEGDPRKVQSILRVWKEKMHVLTDVFTMQFHFLGELRYFPYLLFNMIVLWFS